MVSSTIWAALASPNSAAGSIPFVDVDGATITTDVLNLSYSKVTQDLTVTNGFVPDSFPNTGTPSPVNVNHLYGTVSMAVGTSTVVVNCPLIRAGAKVFVQRQATDTTAVQIAANITVGSFTITANANATAAFNIEYMVINTNLQTQ